MEFQTELWDQLELLMKESTLGREMLNECWEIFNERTQIEDVYAKQLDRLVAQMDKYGTGNHLGRLIRILQQATLVQMEAIRYQSRHIKDMILQPLREVINQQTQSVRKLFEDGRHLSRDIKQKQLDIEKMQQDYNRKLYDYNQHLITMFSQKYVTDIPLEKKVKQTLKRDELIRNLLEFEKKIKLAIESYNAFLEGYQLRMASIMRELQKQDTDRGETLKQILGNFITKGSLLEEINKVDISQYQQEFINQHKSQIISHKPKQFISYPTFINESLQLFQDYFLDAISYRVGDMQLPDKVEIDINMLSILKGSDIEIRQLFHEHSQGINIAIGLCINYVKQFMQDLWRGEQLELTEICTLMERNRICRYVWVQQFQNFRTIKQFELSETAYLKVGALLNNILTICENEYDAYVVRKIIHMSLTFYKTQQNKLYLFDTISEHPIFKHNELWEVIFFESLVEEIKNQEIHKQNEQQHDSVEREKNTVFGFLGSLASNMLMCGQERTGVKHLVTKYAKLYLLPDGQLKMLLSIVENQDK